LIIHPSNMATHTELQSPQNTSPARTGLKVLAGVAALAVLLGVFMLYTQPDFMVTIADQLWACF